MVSGRLCAIASSTRWALSGGKEHLLVVFGSLHPRARGRCNEVSCRGKVWRNLPSDVVVEEELGQSELALIYFAINASSRADVFAMPHSLCPVAFHKYGG